MNAEDKLHSAICNAVILLNNGEEIAPRVSSILRSALDEYEPSPEATTASGLVDGVLPPPWAMFIGTHEDERGKITAMVEVFGEKGDLKKNLYTEDQMRSYREASGFRPINSAPKDGKPVILWGRYWSDSQGWMQHEMVGLYTENFKPHSPCWIVWGPTGSFAIRPTCWRPAMKAALTRESVQPSGGGAGNDLDPDYAAALEAVADQLTTITSTHGLDSASAQLRVLAKNIKKALSTQHAQAVEGDGLPAALMPHAKQWYELCERAASVDNIRISGELAEAIVNTVVSLSTPPPPAGTPQGAGIDWQPSVDTVRNVSRALTRLGHTTPESIEDMAVNIDQWMLTLCSELDSYMDALTSQINGTAGGGDVILRMTGTMVESDFDKNTLTFEMKGDYVAASGEYIITQAAAREGSK